jgi:hypothetical protein
MAFALRRMPSAVVVVVFAVLTSCSADPSNGSGAAPSPSGGVPPSAPAAAPSPAPTGPCAGGTCQIKVAVGDIVTVPERYGLGPIEITAVTADAVEMVAPLTGSGYSVSGCSGGGGVSSQGRGGVRLNCTVGTVATINDVMSLEVVEISATAAVLRIKPAG